MERIRESQLQALVDRLNEVTESPMKPWDRDEQGHSRANIGNYHLSFAYGGVCVHRMHNEHGGVTTPIQSYHSPKRELYDKLRAYLDGLTAAKELTKERT